MFHKFRNKTCELKIPSRQYQLVCSTWLCISNNGYAHVSASELCVMFTLCYVQVMLCSGYVMFMLHQGILLEYGNGSGIREFKYSNSILFIYLFICLFVHLFCVCRNLIVNSVHKGSDTNASFITYHHISLLLLLYYLLQQQQQHQQLLLLLLLLLLVKPPLPNILYNNNHHLDKQYHY